MTFVKIRYRNSRSFERIRMLIRLFNDVDGFFFCSGWQVQSDSDDRSVTMEIKQRGHGPVPCLPVDQFYTYVTHLI